MYLHYSSTHREEDESSRLIVRRFENNLEEVLRVSDDCDGRLEFDFGLVFLALLGPSFPVFLVCFLALNVPLLRLFLFEDMRCSNPFLFKSLSDRLDVL